MFTYPFSNTVVQTICDHFHFFPQNSILAPVTHLGSSLDSKHEQDDETNENQKAKDNGYSL